MSIAKDKRRDNKALYNIYTLDELMVTYPEVGPSGSLQIKMVAMLNASQNRESKVNGQTQSNYSVKLCPYDMNNYVLGALPTALLKKYRQLTKQRKSS